MILYLDASVLMPLVVEEGSSELIERQLSAHDGGLAVSEYAAAETASGVSRLVRMGQLDSATATAALADFDAWRLGSTSAVDLEGGDIRLAHLLVRRFETKLRVGDAVHLALCQRLGTTLVTLDNGLASAAELLGIACYVPSEPTNARS